MPAKKKTTRKKVAAKPRARKPSAAEVVWGRPTKYKPEYAEQAKHLVRFGATTEDLAEIFKVNPHTITNWKRTIPEFFTALRDGRDMNANDILEKKLVHRAQGYSHKETKIVVCDKEIHEIEVIKHYPPDTRALEIWLRNRNPDRWTKAAGEAGGQDEGDQPRKPEIDDARAQIEKELDEFEDEEA